MNNTAKRISSLVSIAGIVCGMAHATSSAQAQGAAASGAIVEVTANGSGCPAGTWDTQISADGLRVVATFTAFSAAVDANRTLDNKTCMLAIEVSDTETYSYAVGSITITGTANVAAGATAQLGLQAYVQGNPADGSSGTSILDAPFEGSFTDTTVFGDPTAAWTPCGPARDLNVSSRVSLRNESATSGSSVDLSANDPETEAGITVQLMKREC